jgi:aspartate/tyrosine/aromatic aminotransferase
MLTDRHHIHLPANGRINVAGLSAENVERAAQAIAAEADNISSQPSALRVR